MDERAGRDLWASFQHDPRDPAAAPLRAADADRELIQSALTDAFADGRLDREEYDERSSAVLRARTLGELPPHVADLVPEQPLVPRPTSATAPRDFHEAGLERWREERRKALFGFLGAAVFFWGIWLFTAFSGDGFHLNFPWPAFVTFFTLMNVVRVAGNRDDIVREEVRRLEKKQAKELKTREELKAREDPAPGTPPDDPA